MQVSDQRADAAGAVRRLIQASPPSCLSDVLYFLRSVLRDDRLFYEVVSPACVAHHRRWGTLLRLPCTGPLRTHLWAVQGVLETTRYVPLVLGAESHLLSWLQGRVHGQSGRTLSSVAEWDGGHHVNDDVFADTLLQVLRVVPSVYVADEEVLPFVEETHANGADVDAGAEDLFAGLPDSFGVERVDSVFFDNRWRVLMEVDLMESRCVRVMTFADVATHITAAVPAASLPAVRALVTLTNPVAGAEPTPRCEHVQQLCAALQRNLAASTRARWGECGRPAPPCTQFPSKAASKSGVPPALHPPQCEYGYTLSCLPRAASRPGTADDDSYDRIAVTLSASRKGKGWTSQWSSQYTVDLTATAAESSTAASGLVMGHTEVWVFYEEEQRAEDGSNDATVGHQRWFHPCTAQTVPTQKSTVADFAATIVQIIADHEDSVKLSVKLAHRKAVKGELFSSLRTQTASSCSAFIGGRPPRPVHTK